jgi:hypothetical protein
MANTFGTFLGTIQKLESTPSRSASVGWPQTEVFGIAKMLLASGAGAMPVKAAMGSSDLPPEAFFGAVVAGRDKGIFEVNEQGPEPVLSLTGLGKSLVS